MPENKTPKSAVSVTAFLSAIADERVRADCAALVEMMRKATGEPPAMWGAGMIGFGHHHYIYESGREGDMMRIGFAPRKANLTLYCMGGWDVQLLAKLGKHKTGVGCLYINKLADVDTVALQALLRKAAQSSAALETSQRERAVSKRPKAPAQPKIEVRNVNVPGYKANVDAAHYNAMKKAMLKVLPKKSPGLTQADLFAAVAPHLPEELFPGGAAAGWWAKCVQLDMEARNMLTREKTKPLRWHRT